MVELTIQMPPELARRLEPIRDRLPELLIQLAEALPSDPLSADTVKPTDDMSLVYSEVIDFLANGPTPQEIVAFKVSVEAQARLRDLLDKNREGILTEAEQAELDLYEQVEHIMILLKARAYTSLA